MDLKFKDLTMLDSMSSLTVLDMPDAEKIIGGGTKMGPYGPCFYYTSSVPSVRGWYRDHTVDSSAQRKDGSLKRCDEK